MLGGKNILLGITGGIAAYKTAFLVRLLVKAGANVKVILTSDARSFVTPLTLATLSKNPVHFDFINEENGSLDWNNHVELGLWADYMIIAPATANTLSKMASGSCDNLLMAAYLSAKCPVFFAPAMDLDMYRHPSTKKSFEILEGFGNIMIPAESGELASGLDGEGRMAEPEHILEFVESYLHDRAPFSGKTFLITAGPTHEPIDPVRFIGNHSTGLMGFALAREAAAQGARVILVSGPTHLQAEDNRIELIRVQSALQMQEVVEKHFELADVVIGAAAVADYRPARVADQKIKKESDSLHLDLVRNPDILKGLGEKKDGQFLVGFALETENEEAHALDKLKRKNLDAIVLNSLQDQGAGFGTPTNKITFLDKNSGIVPFALKSKADVAKDILREILERLPS